MMATLASAVGCALPDDAAEDSHDLMPLWKGGKQVVRTTHVHNTYRGRYAIRHEDWLLVDAKDGYESKRDEAWESRDGYPADDDSPAELYLLTEDLGQRKNLAATNPGKVSELHAMLQKIRSQGYSAPRLEGKGKAPVAKP